MKSIHSLGGPGHIGGVLFCSLIAVCGCQPRTPDVTEHRISQDRVTLENVEAFKQQLEADIPIGSSKADVEKYLSNEGYDFLFNDAGYATQNDPYLGNQYQFWMRDLGLRAGLFQTDLLVEIHFDEQDCVDLIRFSLESEAP